MKTLLKTILCIVLLGIIGLFFTITIGFCLTLMNNPIYGTIGLLSGFVLLCIVALISVYGVALVFRKLFKIK